jgi:cysteine synthase A
MSLTHLEDDVDLSSHEDRTWLDRAIRTLKAEANRSTDTPMYCFPLPADWGVDLYLKDESTHPTGSLKHRLAASLFMHALCSGRIVEGTTIIEASSGSTAVSEAYFARLLGLPFIAVVPQATSPEKLKLIEFYGGQTHLVDGASDIYDVCLRLASECNGIFMDQFTNAERVTDWRGGDNIAASIYRQLAEERHPVPTWIVVGAGTGGTSATIGRYLRYKHLPTGLCVVDPENSVFQKSWRSGDLGVRSESGSVIEGIGRPRVEPSFLPGVVDRMIQVPDAASIAAMRWGSDVTGLSLGGSTGTNLWGALRLAREMRDQGVRGSIVTLFCDGGERYVDSYYDDAWIAEAGLDIGTKLDQIHELVGSGAGRP